MNFPIDTFYVILLLPPESGMRYFLPDCSGLGSGYFSYIISFILLNDSERVRITLRKKESLN